MKTDFIEIKITTNMFEIANKRAIEMGELKYSFMKGKRNLIGTLGEEMYKFYVPNSIFVNTEEYDFLFKTKKIDVKARTVSFKPKNHYGFAIDTEAKELKDQNVDWYVFCGVHKSYKIGWILGFLKKKEFLDLSREVFKGQPRPSGGEYAHNGLEVKISDMRRVQ